MLGKVGGRGRGGRSSLGLLARWSFGVLSYLVRPHPPFFCLVWFLVEHEDKQADLLGLPMAPFDRLIKISRQRQSCFVDRLAPRAQTEVSNVGQRNQAHLRHLAPFSRLVHLFLLRLCGVHRSAGEGGQDGKETETVLERRGRSGCQGERGQWVRVGPLGGGDEGCWGDDPLLEGKHPSPWNTTKPRTKDCAPFRAERKRSTRSWDAKDPSRTFDLFASSRKTSANQLSSSFQFAPKASNILPFGFFHLAPISNLPPLSSSFSSFPTSFNLLAIAF